MMDIFGVHYAVYISIIFIVQCIPIWCTQSDGLIIDAFGLAFAWFQKPLQPQGCDWQVMRITRWEHSYQLHRRGSWLGDKDDSFHLSTTNTKWNTLFGHFEKDCNLFHLTWFPFLINCMVKTLLSVVVFISGLMWLHWWCCIMHVTSL